jgi:hypothetical protein
MRDQLDRMSAAEAAPIRALIEQVMISIAP